MECKDRLVVELQEVNASIEARLGQTKDTYQNDLHALQDSVTTLRAGMDEAKATIEVRFIAKSFMPTFITYTSLCVHVRIYINICCVHVVYMYVHVHVCMSAC